MKKHFFKSLRFRILIITIIATIPYLIFSVYDAQQDRKQDIAQLKSETLQLVNFTLIEETQTLDATRQLLKSLSNLPNEYFLDVELCTKYLSSLLSKYKRYVNFGVVNNYGVLFASAEPLAKGTDFSDKKFFNDAKQLKEFAIGEYLVDSISQKRIINLGYPILDKNQQVYAVAFASLDLSYLEEYDKNLQNLFRKDRLFIKIDNKGAVIISNIVSDELAKSIVTPAFLQTIIEQETGILEATSNINQKYLFVFASSVSPLFQKSLRLVVGVNKADFFSELNNRLYRDLYMFAFLFILILVGVLVLSHKFIIKIVKKLISATKEMSNGNLKARSNVDYALGEFGQLAMSFDQMTESLEKQYAAREKSEKALHESEERFRLLFENSKDAILLTEPDGIILSANPAACAMFQKTEEEMCKDGRDGAVNPKDSRLTVFLEERKKSGNAFAELTLIRKDGTIFPAEISSSIFLDSKGEPKTAMIIRDISERKQTEQKLKESEKLFRTVISNAPISIFATDENGVFTLHEGKAIEKVGMKAGDNVGVSAYELFSGLKVIEHNGNTSTSESILNRVSDGQHVSGITELNGVVFENQFAPILDENGKVAGMLGVATDITERKQAEESLRKSESDLTEAQRLAKIGSWDWDAISDTITWSKAYYHIYGIDLQQSPPGYKEHLKVYTPGSIALLDKAVENSLKTGASYDLDLELASKTSSTRWIRARGECKFNEESKIIGLRGTAQDITERKNFEIKQQFQAKIALNISEGICLVSEADNKIVYANTRFEKLFAYNLGELIGEPVSILDAINNKQKAKAKLVKIRESIHKFGRWQGEAYNIKKDGTKFWTELSVSQFEHPDYGKVYIRVQLDITKRKQAEEKLCEHDKQLKLLSSKLINIQEKERKMLAQELHDEVGQSLMAMKIDLATLKKEIPEEQNPRIHERINEMNTILNGIVNQVHEISLNLRPALIDVLGLMSALKSYSNQFSKRSGIKVHFENDISLDIEKEKEIHIFRIVQEAFTNILKHANAKTIFLNLKIKDRFLIFSIEDDGCGFILKEKISSSQVGIGLIGMRERVHSMKGKMEIITSAQNGTKIEIQIPISLKHD